MARPSSVHALLLSSAARWTGKLITRHVGAVPTGPATRQRGAKSRLSTQGARLPQSWLGHLMGLASPALLRPASRPPQQIHSHTHSRTEAYTGGPNRAESRPAAACSRCFSGFPLLLVHYTARGVRWHGGPPVSRAITIYTAAELLARGISCVSLSIYVLLTLSPPPPFRIVGHL